VADLPVLDIEPGNAFVRLNEVYTYTDSSNNEVSTSSNSSTDIGQSNTSKTMKTDETVTRNLESAGVSGGVRFGIPEERTAIFIQALVEGSYQKEWGDVTTVGVNTEMVRETQRVLEDSHEKGVIFSSGREVVPRT
jgi:hypothetical protein